MNRSYRTALKWILFGQLFLVTMMVQTVILGQTTLWGTKLALVPVLVACVASQLGHEAAGVYALAVALVWSLSGQDSGSTYLLMLPVSALLTGWLCTAYLTRGLLPCLAAAVGSLLLCEGAFLLQRMYMGAPMPQDAVYLVLKQAVFSTLLVPLFWLAARGIGKAVG